MVASVPDSDPRVVAPNRKQRAYQLVDEPESPVTIASAGRRLDGSDTTRIGLTGSAESIDCRSTVSHQRATLSSTASRHDRSVFRVRSGSSSARAVFASATMLT